MFRMGFFSSSSNAVAQSASQLKDIKNTCGIFLKEHDLNCMASLSDCHINILWTNKEQLKSFLFFHKELLNIALQLQPEYLHSFLSQAKMGPCGDAKDLLTMLNKRQCAAPVYCAPSVAYAAPPSIMYAPASVQHAHTATQLSVQASIAYAQPAIPQTAFMPAPSLPQPPTHIHHNPHHLFPAPSHQHHQPHQQHHGHPSSMPFKF